ncbi:MAG: serine/threonine-protein kinase [Gemmatimonadota bacterium]|nr:serine/threonine-protein kinase [Gemmatimonadota bacterium]
MQNLLQRVRAALAGRYEIVSESGRGAMAVVYRAHDPRHDRVVAVKVLAPQLASAIGQERFLHEVRLAAGLAHPYVLPVLDSGEADGLLYYVMPFVEGRSLRDRLTAEGELPIDEAVRITREMAEALEHAHAAGILHRDVKPSNILLTEKHALLADFGVARAIDDTGEERLTGTGLAVGSPAYMSPQQSDPEASPDARDDQYALACVLYEMLAGAPPFTASSRGALLRRHATDPVPSLRTVRPSVPEALEAALERALAKSPTDRFPSVEAFAEAAAAASAAGPGTRRPVASGQRSFRLSRRGTLILAGLALAGLSAAAIVGRSDESPTRANFAVAPCVPSIPSDSVLAADIAGHVTYQLQRLAPPQPVTRPIMSTWQERNLDLVTGAADSMKVRAALADLGARYFVRCMVEDKGDTVSVRQIVFDEEGRAEELPRLSMARVGGTDDVACAMTRQLLDFTGTTLLSEASESLARCFTESQDAFEDFMAAERAFINYDLAAADSLYAQALAADPQLGLAVWRRNNVHRWQPVLESPDIDLDSLFAADSTTFSLRDMLLLRAVIAPKGNLAISRFEAVLEELPRDDYAHLVYADELFHRGALAEMGIGPDSAARVFERALELNPGLGLAWEHLTTVRILLGEREPAREALDRLCAFPTARGSATSPCERWTLGWHERFDPDSAAVLRRYLTRGEDTAALMFAARFARYADLYRAQLHLGNALVRRSRRPDEAWHSGVNAVGIALAALGQPGASIDQFDSARDVDASAALFVDMWAVVPHALGLEGYPSLAAASAATRLEEVAVDAGADSLSRARAAWALALRASDDPGEFRRWTFHVDRLAPSAADAERLRVHLEGLRRARAGDPAGALRVTQPLLAYDSIGSTERPFGRAVLYWQRGEWHRAAGDPDGALAAWMWHWNADIEGQPKREVQAAEIDGAFGAWAQVRSARLAASLGPSQRERACEEARGALDRWAPDPELFGPPLVEEPVARLVEEMRDLAAATCRSQA